MSSRFGLQYAAQICRTGGIIAYPTESVYGLGCDPLNETSVYRLLGLKQRRVEKGLILLTDDLQKLLPFIDVSSQQQKQLLQQQEKPTTWLVAASELTPVWIRGAHAKVAVRITHHVVAAALCALLPYPVVSTSANPASKPPARNVLRIRQYFPGQIDAIVSSATDLRGKPSVIRDLATGEIIRAG
ncbi:MAG: L-threonylcarbamoyladenylate synthase [Pseudomonadota bacterium]|nr:L-threonylcarbamoyladenylate synthase [Pseudomonadota bacterium]